MNVREGVEQMVCAVGAFAEFALQDEVLLTMVEAGGGALFRRYFQLTGDAPVNSAANELTKIFAEGVMRDEALSIAEKQRVLVEHLSDVNKVLRRYSIVRNAIAAFKGDERPEEIDDDWFIDFLEKASCITNEETQRIWENLLVSKARDPRRCSKKLSHTLFLMEEKDAKDFLNLSRFCFMQEVANSDRDNVHPIVFTDALAGTLMLQGLGDNILASLEDLGIINVDFGRGYAIGSTAELRYMNRRIQVSAPEGLRVNVGCVRLTPTGRDLFDIAQTCGASSILDTIIDQLIHRGNNVRILRG